MNLDPQVLLIVGTLLVMLAGWVSLVVPVLPGIFIIWLAGLGYGLLAGWGQWGPWLFGVMTAQALAGMLVDNAMLAAGAKAGGASWRSILIASALAIVGALFFPPVGGLIGGVGGMVLAEYQRVRDWRKAWEATKGMAVGCGGAVVARFLIGAAMIAVWGWWVWLER